MGSRSFRYLELREGGLVKGKRVYCTYSELPTAGRSYSGKQWQHL